MLSYEQYTYFMTHIFKIENLMTRKVQKSEFRKNT